MTTATIMVLIWLGAMLFVLGWLIGWGKGWKDAKEIWEPHAQEMTKIWRDAAMKALGRS